MRRMLTWLDDHLLFLVTGFLLAFIPLYPKLPLEEIIPGYIVRLRIEDFLVAGTIILWLVQLWRKKVSFGPNPLAKPVIAYLTVGALSMLSAIFLLHTVPMETLHIGKMVLHWLRRVEYFSLFFVFYSTVKSWKQVKWYVVILILTMLGVTIYGYGQKYLYWNAYSTMNREFSKGWALVLTQGARVLSTFGGHYDLAAFTMGILVILWSLFFSLKNKLARAGIFIVLAGAFWLLILTVSRTSFLAYLAGVTILFFFWMFRRGIRWSAPRWLGVITLSMVIMLLFGDLSDRFLKLLKLDARVSGIRSLLVKPLGEPPKDTNIAFLDNSGSIADVTSKSDFPPLPRTPSDVINNLPDGFIATESASGSATLSAIPRTYSRAAIVYDLSTGIRLDALWPRAIAGFMRNPLLGSGYSTLNKTSVTEFTEAESTDNDYLRALGETGLLGFLTFGWILAVVVLTIWKATQKIRDLWVFGFLVGVAAVVLALLVNAVYIDVFEASKVAFSFWALVGIALGAIKLLPKGEQKLGFPKIPDWQETQKAVFYRGKQIVKSPKTYLLLIVILALVVRHYKIQEPLADWHSWRQADTSAVTRNFVHYGMNPLSPRYDDLSSVASGKPNPEGYRFVEFPLYNMFAVFTDKLFPGYSIEYSGRLTSVFASLGSLIFIYLITKRYTNAVTALLAAFLFAILPYNIFYSRVILPEPTLVFLSLGMVYFFDRWITDAKKRFYVVSLMFATLALLVKFSVIFFAFPLVYIAWKKWGLKMFINPWLWAFAVITLIPFLLWRVHIAQYPEGIPAYTWLFNGNGIRFKGAWFWWLFAQRIGLLILGVWGVIPLALGLLVKIKSRSTYFFHWWLLGMVAYLALFATGNVQHDYYQTIVVPILVILMAQGIIWLVTPPKELLGWIAKFVAVVSVIFMLMFGWYQVRDYFNINHPEIVEAGQEFERVAADKKGSVIAPYGGDTAFLYQTGRRGWPLMEGTIDEMIEKGADFYISTNFDDLTHELMLEAEKPKNPLHMFKILKQTEKFVIIQLVPDKLLPKS